LAARQLELAVIAGHAHAIDRVAGLGLARVEAPLLVGRERMRLEILLLLCGRAAARRGAAEPEERDGDEDAAQTVTFLPLGLVLFLPSDLPPVGAKYLRLSHNKIGAATKIEE
jgi:hypothetical protein